MSLVPCKECGSQISALARTCPQCGAPCIQRAMLLTPAKSKRIERVVMFAIAFVIVYVIKSGHSTEKPNQPSSSCAVDDLQCIGDKAFLDASNSCVHPIERLAAHSVKWTDGRFESKFTRFRWANKSTGAITFIGDRVEFQNGFGAYTPMIYECDLTKDGKTILDVRVREGRLPD